MNLISEKKSPMNTSYHFSVTEDGNHREAVRTVVSVARIDVRGIEVQVVDIRPRIRSRRPIVAIRPGIVDTATRTITVAGGALAPQQRHSNNTLPQRKCKEKATT